MKLKLSDGGRKDLRRIFTRLSRVTNTFLGIGFAL